MAGGGGKSLGKDIWGDDEDEYDWKKVYGNGKGSSGGGTTWDPERDPKWWGAGPQYRPPMKWPWPEKGEKRGCWWFICKGSPLKITLDVKECWEPPYLGIEQRNCLNCADGCYTGSIQCYTCVCDKTTGQCTDDPDTKCPGKTCPPWE